MAEVQADAEKRRMRIDDFARFQYVGGMRVTADGTHLVYSLSTPSMEKNCYEADLWTLNTATGEQRQLTSTGKEGAFDLLDDDSVLFVSGRRAQGAAAKAAGAGAEKAPAAGELPSEADVCALAQEKAPAKLAEDEAQGTDLYRIALDGGEATLFAHVPLAVLGWRQLDERKFLLLARELADASAAYATITDIPFWENGGTYTSGLREGIYLLDLSEDKPEPHRLTQACESVAGWELSEDRKTLWYLSACYRDRMPLTSRLVAMDPQSGVTRVMDAPEMSYSDVKLAAPGTLVLVGTDMAAHGINEDPQIYALDVDGSNPDDAGANFRRVSRADFDVDFFNAVGSDCRRGHGRTSLGLGGCLYFAHSQVNDSWLSRISVQDGRLTPLVTEEGSVECFDTLDGRTLYYVAMRPGQLAEICRRTVDEAGNAGAEERLTHYSDVLAGIELAEPESFEFESNGDTLTGYVMAPLHHVAGQKAPGVLWVHGGPKTTLGRLLFHEMQYLCGLGYYVFYTNPHGSGGHGIEFSDIRGHYGDVDFDDLMTFTDEVLRRYPDVDAEHLAEMGGSYGGFMTNWVIGHTDRFRCANSQRSISNWVSMFGVADIGYYFADDQTAGWPWGEKDGVPRVQAMWDQSPLKYADQVKTPTLFLHSDCDYRCPLEQGMQMFTALKLHDVPARMVVFKGENHDLSRGGRPQARVRRLAEIANWYGIWLKENAAGEPTLH